MRKTGKKIITLLLVMLLGITTLINKNIVRAATGIGYVNIETTPANERGGEASITYEFSVDTDNRPLMACFVKFTWDASAMTFDETGSITDNMIFTNVDVVNGKADAYIESGIRNEMCGVTLKFTNVLSEGSETVVPVTYTFKEAVLGTVEFVGDDMQHLTIDQIQEIGDSEIVLELPVGVTVTPTTAEVMKGESETFTAKVTNDDSGVTWSVDGSDASIDATGKLTVGDNETAKTVTVTATSVKDPTKKATAIVTIMDKPIVSVEITPTVAEVTKGESQIFTAKVTNDDLGVTWSVDGTDSSMDNTGKLTVGDKEIAKTVTVTATSVKDPTKTATATVTVVDKPMLSLEITPKAWVVFKGEERKVDCKVTATTSVEGTNVVYGVAGNIAKGTTIDANGVLTIAADETAEMLVVTVIATNEKTEPSTTSKQVTIKLAEPEITVDVADGDITITENTEGKLVITQGGEEIIVEKGTLVHVENTTEEDNTVVIDGTEVDIVGNVDGDIKVITEGTVNIEGDVNGNVIVEKGSIANITGNVNGKITNNGGEVNVGGNVIGNIETTDGGKTNIDTDVKGNIITTGEGSKTNVKGQVIEVSKEDTVIENNNQGKADQKDSNGVGSSQNKVSQATKTIPSGDIASITNYIIGMVITMAGGLLLHKKKKKKA